MTDTKGIKAAAEAFHDGPLGADEEAFDPKSKSGQWCMECARTIIDAYCKAEGVVMVPREALETSDALIAIIENKVLVEAYEEENFVWIPKEVYDDFISKTADLHIFTDERVPTKKQSVWWKR